MVAATNSTHRSQISRWSRHQETSAHRTLPLHNYMRAITMTTFTPVESSQPKSACAKIVSLIRGREAPLEWNLFLQHKSHGGGSALWAKNSQNYAWMSTQNSHQLLRHAQIPYRPIPRRVNAGHLPETMGHMSLVIVPGHTYWRAFSSPREGYWILPQTGPVCTVFVPSYYLALYLDVIHRLLSLSLSVAGFC